MSAPRSFTVLSVWADAAPTQKPSATGAAKRKIARFMKQPFLRDCPWGLDYKLRDLSGFFLRHDRACGRAGQRRVPAYAYSRWSIRHLKTISYGGQGVDGRGT